MNKFIFAILTAIFWGISYAACEYAIKNIDKRLFFLCTGICTALFWVVYFMYTYDHNNNFKFTHSSLLWLIVSVSAGLFGNYFCIRAIQDMGAVKASAIEITYPIFCMLFMSICSLKMTLNIQQMICMLIVILGSAAFMLFDKP